MKINYPDKAGENKETYPGDLIKFGDGTIGLVLVGEKFISLKFSNGADWFDDLTGTYGFEFKEGKYKIIARAKDWEINVLKWIN